MIGNHWFFVKTAFHPGSVDLPAQASRFPDLLDQSHHVSHSVLMLGDLVIKQQPGEGLDQGKGNLGLEVREGGVRRDEETVDKKRSILGQWSPVTDLL